MTERLYYRDSHCFDFTAQVLSCEPAGERYRIVLDRTAFFPEGGGQQADTGSLNGQRVLDVREGGEDVYHLLAAALEPGTEVKGSVDRALRLARMQNHSGEHILSGTAHRLWGCANVGFHMGEHDVTIDFDRELDAEQLRTLETLANEKVWENLPVRAWFPTPEALQATDYRSKKALEGDVRLVEIPGVDCCACCAPHVSFTGEVGVIKILEAERHRGGIRLTAACGVWALKDYCRKQESTQAISVLLSAKRDEVSPAVEKLKAERDTLKEKNACLAQALIQYKAAAQPETDGNICLFEELPDEIAARELVNLLTEKTPGLAAVFFPGEGGALRYIIGSRTMDLRKASRDINAGIGGRGGGRPEMIQGSAAAAEETIRAFLLAWRGKA